MNCTRPIFLVVVSLLAVHATLPGSSLSGHVQSIPAAKVPVDPPPTPERRPARPEDIAAWREVSGARLSPDGKWFAHIFGPSQSDRVAIVRRVEDDREYRFPVGSGMKVPGPQFSSDGKWVAIATVPLASEARELKARSKPVQPGVRLVELGTGKDFFFARVRRSAFTEGKAPVFVMHRYGAMRQRPGDKESSALERAESGSDLIIRDLASGAELTVGNVSDFAIDKTGRRVAWTTRAEDEIGNGVSMLDLETRAVTVVDNGRAVYERLGLTDDGDALAVLKGAEWLGHQQLRYSVVAVTRLSSNMRKTEIDPATDETFPKELVVSPFRSPTWASDREHVLFGLVNAAAMDDPGPVAQKSGADPAPRSTLVLWHWKDPRLQMGQKADEELDKQFSYLSAYNVADRKYVRLADEEVADVLDPVNKWCIGTDRRAYKLAGNLDGRQYQDLYAIELATGERKLLVKRVRAYERWSVQPGFFGWMFRQSPDGSKVLYYDEGHFYVVDTTSGASTNITHSLPVSFVSDRREYNIVNDLPIPDGWTSDSKAVLLTDKWDSWLVPIDGSKAVNLTGDGRRKGIRYRLVRTARDEEAISLTSPIYYQFLDEATKMGGYSRLLPGRPAPERLLWDDAYFVNLSKADAADTYVYTKESKSVFPDYYIADPELKRAKRVTDGQSQLQNYLWGSDGRLLEYDVTMVSGRKKRLQAALYLPANYVAGRRYPTVVEIYQKLSERYNWFQPLSSYGFMRSLYTSNGYAVLTPDISYEINDPGVSALKCVQAAVAAAESTGVIDSSRLGIYGYSWGGYETAFILTQTDAFRAAAGGAGFSNLISEYNLIYRSSGSGMSGYFESGQGRFRGGYLEYWDHYVKNSPIVHVKNVKTPVLWMHNDKDGAVDFTQGIELYNALRRLQKPVVMLEYEGENHALSNVANRLDYTIRMKEYFDYYLKDGPAPSWWESGVPRREMDKHLRTRMKPREPESLPNTPSQTSKPF